MSGVGGFPNLRRPKILWTDLGDGVEKLKTLHDDLETELLKLGCYRREDRAYTPHLTLGRLTAENREEDWGAILAQYADWHGGISPINEVLIMTSDTKRGEPVYSVVGRAKLAGIPEDVEPDDEDEDEE